MPVTAIDPNVALLVVDLQKGIVATPCVHPTAEIVGRAAGLAEAFRRRSLPVVLVRVDGLAPGRTEQALGHGERPADWTDFAAELNRQPQDHAITKRTWGAFTGTGLDAHLRGRGITQVVIAGLVTSIGVQSTARQAYELGYNVTLAVDAMTDRDGSAHASSVDWVFPKLGETGTAQEIVSLLETTAS